jgi:hypothetical protein
MKRGFVKSSPVFFRLIGRSLAGFVLMVLALAALIPAPLQQQADPARTPNPVKSAWFLLWIQELVSYSRLMIYPVVALGLLFLLLPWLVGSVHLPRGRWFPPEQRGVNLVTVVFFAAILLLTVIALWFRGENWSFVAPF